MSDIFISYAREDREIAGRLAGALEAAGWSVWWDSKLRAGTPFDRVIERELDAAASVIVLWSEHSAASEWVQHEATAAADRGVLVPARIDEARLPLAFRRHQAADLIGWEGDPRHPGYKAILEAVANLVGAPPSASAKDLASLRVPASSFDRRLRRLSAIALIAAAVVVVGYVVSRMAAPEAAAPNGTSSTSPVGTFEFKWPGGGDCWKIYRGDVEVMGSCGGGKHVLQAGSYVVKPRNSEVFLPFAVTIKPGLTASADASAGTFEFKWPGNDCWNIYRGDVEIIGSCGDSKQVLQAGSYVVKPRNSEVFLPFAVTIKPGRTASADASAGTLEFKWPGKDCWKIYRGDVEVKSSCGGGKHVLQAGSYVVKPSGSSLFDPLRVDVKSGKTTSMP